MFWISKESTTNKREINACSVCKTIHNFIIDKKQIYIKETFVYMQNHKHVLMISKQSCNAS